MDAVCCTNIQYLCETCTGVFASCICTPGPGSARGRARPGGRPKPSTHAGCCWIDSAQQATPIPVWPRGQHRGAVLISVPVAISNLNGRPLPPPRSDFKFERATPPTPGCASVQALESSSPLEWGLLCGSKKPTQGVEPTQCGPRISICIGPAADPGDRQVWSLKCLHVGQWASPILQPIELFQRPSQATRSVLPWPCLLQFRFSSRAPAGSCCYIVSIANAK